MLVKSEIPRNIEAENIVLGYILMDNHILSTIKPIIMSSDYFTLNKNKMIWTAMNELDNKGRKIDLLSLKDKFEDMYGKNILSSDDLDKIRKSVMDDIDVKQAAGIIRQKYLQRNIIEAAGKLQEIGSKQFDKMEEFLIEQQKVIDNLYSINPLKDQLLPSIINEIKDNIVNKRNIIKFNVNYLDDYAGGMTRQELTSLGGRPGNGKTTLMMNTIKALIESGLNVHLFNREMSNESALTKLFVIESDKLTMNDFRGKDISNETIDEIDRLTPLISEKYKNLRMYDKLLDLDSSLIEIRRYQPDVFFDDYIQQVIVNRFNESRRFDIENIMRGYKAISKSTNSSGFLISQLKRIEDRIDPTPTMGDYAEGSSIEQESETCLFIFYPYYFNPIDNSKYKTQVIVKKARYGEIGTYEIGFNGAKSKFYTTSREAEGL